MILVTPFFVLKSKLIVAIYEFNLFGAASVKLSELNKEIFLRFPQYIRITICAQIKKLLSTPYFGYDDREDIAQDMLCHYLYKSYEIPDAPEALVVHDLRQYALHLPDIRKRTQLVLPSDFSYAGPLNRAISLAEQKNSGWSPMVLKGKFNGKISVNARI
ncbi:MAG: hypothetical protein IJ529_01520, partial [Alphaproteobacteria bacterium]|nr:hypothetical protein [Alphaproteobacteria bacterium]